MKRYSLFALIALVSYANCAALVAAPILDQNQPATTTSNISIRDTNGSFNDYLIIGQTFTNGLSGQLTRVDIVAYRSASTTAPLDLEIHPLGLGGIPDDTAAPLAAASLPAASFATTPSTSNWVSFDLTASNLFVTAADQLAIVVSTTAINGSTPYGWLLRSPDSYAGGSTFLSRGAVGDGAWNPLTFGLSFRTFVDPEAVAEVPEPTSFALFAVGSVCLVVPLWRRRKTQSIG